jgi:hypothetical protein
LVKSIDPKIFVFDFLTCFGFPKATVARLSANGDLNLAVSVDCVLLKGKLYFVPLKAKGEEALTTALELALADRQITSKKPAIFMVTNFKTVLAFDTKSRERTSFPLEALGDYYDFFLPLAGMQKTVVDKEVEADVKAASKMAKLYEQIRKDNPDVTKEQKHSINVFLTRLLFCFFAEDTDIFDDQSFTKAIEAYTQENGADLPAFFKDLFLALSTSVNDRFKTPAYLKEFPYVNGGLFDDTHAKLLDVPKFSSRARRMLIELGQSDWKAINPDIFGSMFQGVVDEEKRADLGMHYTSVPNIMKVIRPLFLDSLYEEFEGAKGSEKKLNKLLERLSAIRVFDPACGSGNFLIIAYKELRQLELLVFVELRRMHKQFSLRFSGIAVKQFFGIEIDDFAREVAVLALWLTEHQMNVKFKAQFGSAPRSLPLKQGAKIVCANALRVEWKEVCPVQEETEVFVLGNPPYLGSRMQDSNHKEDLKAALIGITECGNLDYISGWFFKGSSFVEESHGEVAFVTTNSICQGEQVQLLWPHLLANDVEIGFAHASFKWSNNAKGQAGVTCAIVSLRKKRDAKKRIFSGSATVVVENINPYLSAAENVFIDRRREPLSSNFPIMDAGSRPTDGGHLIMRLEEKSALLEKQPVLSSIIHPFMGSEEFLSSTRRYCLWIDSNNIQVASAIPEIQERFHKVREMRLGSTDKATRRDAETPHRFQACRYQRHPSILMPKVSSERRLYIPCGYVGSDVVISDLAFAIYRAETWLFGVISSQMHMVWTRAVAGRLEERIRYSNTIVYNNFPFPKISTPQQQLLTDAAQKILDSRDQFPGKSIAYLYDPDTMPKELLAAHQALDAVVEQCYRKKPFTSDQERLEYLFDLYEKMAKEADPK